MYMERGKQANALGMDSFDRAIEYAALSSEMASGSIDALCSSISPPTYTVSDGGTGFSNATKAIDSITLDGNKLAIRDSIATLSVDRLDVEVNKLTAALKKLGEAMGVDPFKNTKNDFKTDIGVGFRLKRSQLKTL